MSFRSSIQPAVSSGDHARRHHQGAPEDGPEARVTEVMRRSVPVVQEGASLEEAFQLLQESNSPALPVVGRWRRMVGLLMLENIGELMMIRSVMPEQKRAVMRKAIA